MIQVTDRQGNLITAWISLPHGHWYVTEYQMSDIGYWEGAVSYHVI